MMVIKYNLLKVVRLSPENISSYQNMISDYKCANTSINNAIADRIALMSTKAQNEYDNRDTVFLFVLKDSTGNTVDIMGYTMFCAASVKNGKVVIPAAEIKTFSVSEKYSKKFASVELKDGNQLTCARYILEYLMNHFDHLSKSIGITHVVLESASHDSVRHFYETNGFAPYSASTKQLGVPDTHNHFIRTLKNALARKF